MPLPSTAAVVTQQHSLAKWPQLEDLGETAENVLNTGSCWPLEGLSWLCGSNRAFSSSGLAFGPALDCPPWL